MMQSVVTAHVKSLKHDLYQVSLRGYSGGWITFLLTVSMANLFKIIKYHTWSWGNGDLTPESPLIHRIVRVD